MLKFSSWLFFLSLIGLSQSALGQDYVDLFRIQYSRTPKMGFQTDTGTFQARYPISELGVDLTIPIRLNEHVVIISGYSFDELNVEPLGFNAAKNTYKMHSIKAGLSWQHNETWSGQYLLLPKTTGSLDNINNKNFQLAGLALVKRKKKKNLFYRYGLYYNSEIFGPFFVPLLGIWYRSPNKKFELNWTLPVWADMNYTWKPWFTTGLNFQSFVRTFYRHNQNIEYSDGSTSNSEQYMVKASNEIYLYTQFNIKKSFLIQTKVGHSIGRSFRHYNHGDNVNWGLSAFKFGDNRTQLNPDLKDGLIFQIRLIYRYWIKEEEVDETARLF